MKVLITQPWNKGKLVAAFEEAGAEVVATLEPDVKLIIPTVDEEMWFFSRSREWFKKQGITVACSNEYAVSTCRDKAEFYRFCRRHSFPVPETSQFDAIVKPRFGKGSRGQLKIDRSYICQEIITWPEYSIDYYKDDTTVSVVPRLRLDIVNGESKGGLIVDDVLLIKEATRLGEELGLEYHNVMQCFYDGTHIKWIEVNPRYGGGSWITFGRFYSPKHLMETLQ